MCVCVCVCVCMCVCARICESARLFILTFHIDEHYVFCVYMDNAYL